MANLSPISNWSDVPQLELNTQAYAGPGGIMNAQAQAVLNNIQALRTGRLISPIDPDWGAAGNGVADDYTPLQNLLNSLKLPGLDLSTSAAAKAALRGLPRVTIDLCGKTYMISQPLDFADLYNVTIRNGVIMAHPSWSGGATAMLYVAKPQATDIYHDQRIRFLTFSSVTCDGNGLANCVYLENSFCTTFENFYCLGWPNGGIGLWTCDASTTPNKSNTHLRIQNSVFFQSDAAEITPKNAQPESSGTCISLKTGDFFIDGLVCAYADVLLELDNFYNGQVSNFHPYCKSYEKCLVLGAGAHHVAFDNCYFDTGIVEIRSFDHSMSSAVQFLAGANVKLIATAANETMGGMDMRGIFANAPQYLTEGAGTWSATFRGRVVGWDFNGNPVPSRGSEIVSRQSAARVGFAFSDDSSVDYNTGYFSPAANMWGYSLTGTEIWRRDDTGRDIYGAQSNILTGQSASPRIQVHGSVLSDSTVSTTRWSATASAQGQFVVARSRSATPGTYSAIQAGDALGRYAFCGDTGVNLNSIGAAITAKAASTWTSSNASTTLTLQTTPNSSLTPVDCWDVRQNKHFVPVGDVVADIGESANQVRKVYAQTAVFTNPMQLASYTVATLPAASTFPRGLIYVSDGTSNKRLAVSDGTNWRWPDGAIVS